MKTKSIDGMSTIKQEVKKLKEQDISKMNTVQIVSHLIWRHRTFLWALAFFVTNSIWLVRHFN
jgi:hypothetical protein